jgi:hypothetical protein
MISVILISCLGIIVYSNSFLCSFHFDDNPFIIDNPFIRNIHHLQTIWAGYPCRFITYLSYAFNYHYHRLDVAGYHLFNLAVHIGSACLVWWLTLLTLSTPALKDSLTESKHRNIIALFAGLIFVSHPLQTEGVTYIYQRAASMATLFYLASLCFYVKSRLLQDNRSFYYHYYICSLLMAVLAMFTKEISITLPLIILLYEICFLNTKRSLNWGHLAPFLLTILTIPLTMLLTRSEKIHEIQAIAKSISPAHYLLTQFRVVLTYIRLIFLPLNQNFDYDYPISKSLLEWPVLFNILFLGTVLFTAKQLFLKYRLVSFSIFWFFLTLLPESSFLPETDLIYEHRLYLPLAGLVCF